MFNKKHLLLALLLPTSVFAQKAGDLDTTFKVNGSNLRNFGKESYGTAMAYYTNTQKDFLVAGYTLSSNTSPTAYDFLVTRYKGDGTADMSFGDNGKTIVDIGGLDDRIYAVKFMKNGFILCVGNVWDANAKTAIGLLKLTPAGMPDSTFGNNGIVITHPPSGYSYEGQAVVIDSLDDIYVAGSETNMVQEDKILLAKYNSNGQPDSTFGTGGIAIQAIPGYISCKALSADGHNGNIVVGGFASDGTNSGYMAASFTKQGIPDTSFGGSNTGYVILRERNSIFNRAKSITSGYGNGYYLGGAYYGDSNLVVAKINSNGIPDSSFGSNGIITIPRPAGIEQMNLASISCDSVNGFLYISGTQTYTFSTHISSFVYRYKLNGTTMPDSSFGINGRANLALGHLGGDAIMAMAPNEWGDRIVVAGAAATEYLGTSYINVMVAAFRTFGVQSPVGVQNTTIINNNVKVYPNPTNGTCTVLYTLQEKADITITVQNLQGQIVLQSIQQTNMDKGTHQAYVDMSSLTNGVYIVSVGTPAQKQTVLVHKQ